MPCECQIHRTCRKATRTRAQATRPVLWLAAAMIVVWPALAPADEWPQWRGSDRDGRWNETGIVQRFDGPQLPIRWRVPIGNGYSGPTVADGRVFVTDRVTKPTQGERVHCLDADTGRSLWSFRYDCEYKKVGYPGGPRAAVTVDGPRAYALGTMGHLHCFNAETGDVLWQRNLYDEYKIRMPIWGISAAPLIEGDLVIVHIGGSDDACLVAFEKTTGQERWRALADTASYAAPIVIEQAGQRVLVCVTGERVVGMDPRTGQLYWHQPFPASRMVITITTPVLHDGFLLVSSFYDGSLLLKLDPDRLAATEVWRRQGPSERDTDALHCCISTPIIQGRHIYGVDSHGELRCLDLMTGDRIWEDLTAVPKARWSNIHLIRNAEKVWMFNERGELIISTLSPQGFHEISRTKLIEPTTGQLNQRGGVCWSHPAFAYKRVYARNDEELVCADLSAAEATPALLQPYLEPPAEFAGDTGAYRSPLKFDDGSPVRTPQDWQRRRAEILATWRSLTGPWPPLIEKPQVQSLETTKRDNFTQQKVTVQIAPNGQTVDGYLLIPDGRGPFPAVLVVYYDAETGVGLGKELRDFGSQLARRGFVALSIGTPAFASLEAPYKPLWEVPEGQPPLQPLSALAYVAANCHTALARLPQVDPERIGVVGHSYGGKWAMFASCLYEKFACAVWSDPGIVFDETRPNVNYWEPWYLGWDPNVLRQRGVPSDTSPRTGPYKQMIETGRDLHELHALMAPRPFLVSGGAEDPPQRWQALNHTVAVNALLGHAGRVAMTHRPTHNPTAESNGQIYTFFEHCLKLAP